MKPRRELSFPEPERLAFAAQERRAGAKSGDSGGVRRARLVPLGTFFGLRQLERRATTTLEQLTGTEARREIQGSDAHRAEQALVPRDRVRINSERRAVDSDMPGRLGAIRHHESAVLMRDVRDVRDRLDGAGDVGRVLADDHLRSGRGDRALDILGVDVSLDIDGHLSHLHSPRDKTIQGPHDGVVLGRDDDDAVSPPQGTLQYQVEGGGASRLEHQVPVVRHAEQRRELSTGVRDRPTRGERERV